MRVIAASTLRKYYTKHADAKAWLLLWLRVAKQSSWADLTDVRKAYKKADAVVVQSGATVTIFDVKGNRYRLIVAIHYNRQRVYIRDFLTHEAYNDQRWKSRH